MRVITGKDKGPALGTGVPFIEQCLDAYVGLTLAFADNRCSRDQLGSGPYRALTDQIFPGLFDTLSRRQTIHGLQLQQLVGGLAQQADHRRVAPGAGMHVDIALDLLMQTDQICHGRALQPTSVSRSFHLVSNGRRQIAWVCQYSDIIARQP
ncbi:hypothetical protein D3C77_154610 [compost metagenome]